MATIFEVLNNIGGTVSSFDNSDFKDVSKKISEDYIKLENQKLNNLLLSNILDNNVILKNIFIYANRYGKIIVYRELFDESFERMKLSEYVLSDEANYEIDDTHIKDIFICLGCDNSKTNRYDIKTISLILYPELANKLDKDHKIGFEIKIFYSCIEKKFLFGYRASKSIYEYFNKNYVNNENTKYFSDIVFNYINLSEEGILKILETN